MYQFEGSDNARPVLGHGEMRCAVRTPQRGVPTIDERHISQFFDTNFTN
jgi:hypothetical protein